MSLTLLAKISAAYIGFAVTFATASALWDARYDLAGQTGLLRGSVTEARAAG